MEQRNDHIYQKIGIYGIKNKVNGKIYIGKTGMNFGDRWDSHRALLRNNKHFNSYLQHAWNKYGEDNFEFIIVEECSVNQLNDKEKYYISYYKKLNKSYNIADGGEGGCFLGKHLSDETKKKIGEKNRIHMLGRKMSDNTKQKMSNSQKQRYSLWSDQDRIEWGQMTSKCASGYHWSEESKKKMKDNKNGATHSVDEIKFIRSLHENDNKTCREIADSLHLSYDFVYEIITYRRWKNI